MKINISEKENVNIVELSGELDFHSSPDLRDKLNAMTDKKDERILINLKKVPYMDSSGIATFVETFQKLKKYDGKLVLAELTREVRSVFEIAKLDSIFELATTQEDGIQKLGA